MANSPKAGTVFRIELEDGRHTYARIASSTQVAVYDAATDESLSIDELKENPILFIVSCVTPVAKEAWEQVGFRALEKDEIPIPMRFNQNIYDPTEIYIVDEIGNQKPATYEEVKGLESAVMWHPDEITERVRDHYAGRVNEDLQSEALKDPSQTKQRDLSAEMGVDDVSGFREELDGRETGHFANDAAADLGTEVREVSDSLDCIREALEKPAEDLKEFEYVDCDICQRAIAAAAIVLALSGAAPDGMPDGIRDWSREAASSVSEEELRTLRRVAVQALEICLGDNSECVELWSPVDGGLVQWRGGVEALIEALQERQD